MMEWFKKKQPDPEKAKRAEDRTKNLLQSADSQLRRYLKISDDLGSLAEIANADEATKRAYMQDILDAYEAQEGHPFVAEEYNPEEGWSVSDARAAVQNVIGHLDLIQEFKTQPRTQFDVEAFAKESEKKGKEKEKTKTPYETELETLYGHLIKRIDRAQPIIDQVSSLIDRVPDIKAFGEEVLKALPGNEQEKRARLKDALILLLVRDGYFNKS